MSLSRRCTTPALGRRRARGSDGGGRWRACGSGSRPRMYDQPAALSTTMRSSPRTPIGRRPDRAPRPGRAKEAPSLRPVLRLRCASWIRLPGRRPSPGLRESSVASGCGSSRGRLRRARGRGAAPRDLGERSSSVFRNTFRGLSHSGAPQDHSEVLRDRQSVRSTPLQVRFSPDAGEMHD